MEVGFEVAALDMALWVDVLATMWLIALELPHAVDIRNRVNSLVIHCFTSGLYGYVAF